MSTEHPTILFDGVCNFCNNTINFIIRQDKKGIFRFAPLQSPAGQQLLRQYKLPLTSLNSFLLIDGSKVYKASTAGLKLYGKLSARWQWTQLFWVVPPFIRDGLYNFIAKNRYKWFGKREACMVPTPALRSRFLS